MTEDIWKWKVMSARLCERRKHTWYGVLDMQTSKYGNVAFTKSPITISRRRCSGLNCRLSISLFSGYGYKVRTFPALASSTQPPYEGPSPPLYSASPFPVSVQSGYRYQDRLRAPCQSGADWPKDERLQGPQSAMYSVTTPYRRYCT